MTDDRKHDSSEGDGQVVPLRRRAAKCPVCGKPAASDRRPFCSKRCADLDLGRWLNGTYRVPTEEPADTGDLHGDDGHGEEQP